MEAKDTVMNEDEKKPCVFKDKGGYRTPWSIADKTAKAQSEISFKAGIREAVEQIEKMPHGTTHCDIIAKLKEQVT